MFYFGFFLTIVVLLCKPLLYKMGQPKEVVIYAYPYLKWVGISLIPLIIFQGSNNLQKDYLLQDLQCMLL